MNSRWTVVLSCTLLASLLPFLQTPARAQETTPVAETAPAAKSAALPDIPSLLKAVEANAKELEKTRKDYLFLRADQVDELDGNGRVKSTERLDYEVHFVEGQEILRLTTKNGKRLSDADQKKEDEKVAKHEKRAREEAANPQKREADEDALTPTKFVAADRFYNLRRELLDGKQVLAFDFEPRPEYQGKGMLGKILHVLAGTIWIDEESREIVKLHAELQDGMKIAGGLVASVKKGAYLNFENARINNEVWLPSAGEANFGYRVFFSRKNMRVKFRYSDYRKFRSESKITSVSEEVPVKP